MTRDEFDAAFSKIMNAAATEQRPHRKEVGVLMIGHHDDHGMMISGNMCRACLARLLAYALDMLEDREGITPASPCNEDEMRGPVGHA